MGSLFGRFERAGREDRLGLGLELYVARRAADLLGAQLIAASGLGRGARFVLELPHEVLRKKEA